MRGRAMEIDASLILGWLLKEFKAAVFRPIIVNFSFIVMSY